MARRGSVDEKKIKRVLDHIQRQYETYGYVHSQLNISMECGISTSTITKYLDILQARGHITREPNVPCSIKPINQEVS